MKEYGKWKTKKFTNILREESKNKHSWGRGKPVTSRGHGNYKTLIKDPMFNWIHRCWNVGCHCPLSHRTMKTGKSPLHPKCLSNVNLVQNSNNTNISCMQGTHYSYLNQHHVRSDTLQAQPSKIFTMESLGFFIFPYFTEKYKAKYKIKKKFIHHQKYANTCKYILTLQATFIAKYYWLELL